MLGRPEAYDRADELCTMLPTLQSEEFDPARREARGNIPLVWSHAECARALFELDRQRRVGIRLKRALTAAPTPAPRRGLTRLRGGQVVACPLRACPWRA